MTDPRKTTPDEKRPSSELIAELKGLRLKPDGGGGDYPTVAHRTAEEQNRVEELERILRKRGHL